MISGRHLRRLQAGDEESSKVDHFQAGLEVQERRLRVWVLHQDLKQLTNPFGGGEERERVVCVSE